MRQASLRMLGWNLMWWLTLAALCVALSLVDVSWSFLAWTPSWSLHSAVGLLGILLAPAALYWLGRGHIGWLGELITLVAALYLAWLALDGLAAEPIQSGSDIFGRGRPSYFLYRFACALALCLPLGFWWRHFGSTWMRRAHGLLQRRQ